MAIVGPTPIIVGIPTSAILTRVVRIPLGAHAIVQSLRIMRIEGSLQAIASGTFSIDIMDMHDNSVFATLSWTVQGVQFTALDYLMNQDDSGIRIDVTSIGVGAIDCFLIIWLYMDV
jgi:hypothetical protein